MISNPSDGSANAEDLSPSSPAVADKDSHSLPERPPHARLTRALVVAVVALIVIIIAITAMFTVPIVRRQVTSTQWTEWHLVTGPTPGQNETQNDLLAWPMLCDPSDAVSNLSVSLVWQSTSMNTTALFFWWNGNVEPPVTVHVVYWVNDSSSGGYSFPPSLSTMLCKSGGDQVVFRWITPYANAVIMVNMIQEYNTTALQPEW